MRDRRPVKKIGRILERKKRILPIGQMCPGKKEKEGPMEPFRLPGNWRRGKMGKKKTQLPMGTP